jgi:hypothetical protein
MRYAERIGGLPRTGEVRQALPTVSDLLATILI